VKPPKCPHTLPNRWRLQLSRILRGAYSEEHLPAGAWNEGSAKLSIS